MTGGAPDPHPVFTSARLRGRRLHAGDAGLLQAVYGDADAMRWVGDGEPISQADCVRWLNVTAANYVRYGYGMFVLERQDTGAAVGCIGLVHPGGQPETEIKYALLRAHWGQGYASEAAAALLDWGRRVQALRHVIATTAPENAASHRVLEKAGMQRGAVRVDAGEAGDGGDGGDGGGDGDDGLPTLPFHSRDASAARAAFAWGALFRTADLAARALRADEVPQLQALFDANPQYFLAVEGSPAGPDAAQGVFDGRPEAPRTWSAHHLLGVFDAAGVLVGTVLVATDLDLPGVWHIATFLLADRLHGSGAAQALHAALAAWAEGAGARWLRLRVVVGHARAERFWERQGYADVGRHTQPAADGQLRTLRTLVRGLGGHTPDGYRMAAAAAA